MFETLFVGPEQYRPRVEQLIEMLRQAAQKKKQDQPLSHDEIGAIFTVSRLRALEQEWRGMENEQKAIMKPIEDYLSVLNRLFRGKSLRSNPRNELEARLENRDHLDLKDLSSGEKQMIILLGEALLQHGAVSVYLADEPELSLHVGWQEQLVSSLRELNPSAQLIFATHSPDIVSTYDDRAINMETVLQ